MATPLLFGLGAVAAAIAGRSLLRSGALRIGGKAAQDQWAKGGFRSKMDRREAIAILGLKDNAAMRTQIKDAHRQIMISNHPDRGGSPYLASKINEAKDLLEKTDGSKRR